MSLDHGGTKILQGAGKTKKLDGKQLILKCPSISWSYKKKKKNLGGWCPQVQGSSAPAWLIPNRFKVFFVLYQLMTWVFIALPYLFLLFYFFLWCIYSPLFPSCNCILFLIIFFKTKKTIAIKERFWAYLDQETKITQHVYLQKRKQEKKNIYIYNPRRFSCIYLNI